MTAVPGSEHKVGGQNVGDANAHGDLARAASQSVAHSSVHGGLIQIENAGNVTINRAQTTVAGGSEVPGEGVSQRPGRPLTQVSDPFHLEVHRAIEADKADLPPLPVYVAREHDRLPGEVVARAVAGESQIAVLVGGSSTGKTRACWEALPPLRAQPRELRAQPQEWWLWHPIDPARPDAALADLGRIEPYTVVWLNEAQFYLADPALGERVAAGLRELLRDPRRAPGTGHVVAWPAA